MSGLQQVGNTRFMPGFIDHASLWSGTAASWVDLHPAGASESFAFGISGAQQVGSAQVAGGLHAGTWNDTAASWVDLNPAGALRSEAYASDGSRQVGAARFPFQFDHAGVWSGTSASWVDLHASLPAEFIQSRADAIWTDGAYTYVAGSAWFQTEFNHRAILWVQSVPEPASLGLMIVTVGGLTLPRRRTRWGAGPVAAQARSRITSDCA